MHFRWLLPRVSGRHQSLRDRGTLADWQVDATSFEAIAGYRWATVDVVEGAQSDRLNGLMVTPEFFEVFGVPLLGRSFLAEDRGADAVVLGNDVWRRRFDAFDALVGSTVDLHARDLSRVGPTRYTVLGVATAPVRFPTVYDVKGTSEHVFRKLARISWNRALKKTRTSRQSPQNAFAVELVQTPPSAGAC